MDFVCLNTPPDVAQIDLSAHEYNVVSLKPPQGFSWLQLRNSEVEFEDYFESEVDFGVDFRMTGNGAIHKSNAWPEIWDSMADKHAH